jgi:predicted dehydrogenase
MVRPAAEELEAEVTAVAAREIERAAGSPQKHKLPTAYGSYAQLLADPSIDAVYIAVPNALHRRWTKAALDARKHVLCEKPFIANAEEAASVAEASRRSGLVVMEAFHYGRTRGTATAPLPASCGRSQAPSCGGEPLLTGPDDAVANLMVIDACYAAAGLPRREPSQ